MKEIRTRPKTEQLSLSDKQYHAQALSDPDLCSYLETAFSATKAATTYNLPYLAEARNRFAKQGRRVPVPGNPSWSEWVSEHLGISDRHVRRLLAGYRDQQSGIPPKPKKQPTARPLPRGLAAKAVELAQLVISGDAKAAQRLADTILQAAKGCATSLSTTSVAIATPCRGCEQLHSGIANILTSDPKKPLSEVAANCGVSVTVVRQAATRYGIVSGVVVNAPRGVTHVV